MKRTVWLPVLMDGFEIRPHSALNPPVERVPDYRSGVGMDFKSVIGGQPAA